MMDNEQLVARIKAGEDEAENMLQLWQQNRGFIATMARKYVSLAEMEDLEQEGYIGLCEAVRHYEPCKEVPFINYAAFWIRQAMRRYIDNCGAVVRLPSNMYDWIRKYKKTLREYHQEYKEWPSDSALCWLMGVSRKKLQEIQRATRMADIGSLDAPLEGAEDFTSAAIALVKRTIRDHRRVIFNGDGYSAEWELEAERRGLPNKKYSPAALPALIAPKNIQLMEEFGVMTRTEMFSRYEVEMEHYAKIINIEALTMLEMARRQLLPAINSYMGDLARTITAKRAVSEHLSVKAETAILERLARDADTMSETIAHLAAAERTAQTMADMTAKANAFHDKVLPLMDALRSAADDAETVCGDKYWPLPSYSKMLYYVEK